jgi:hypothetical protein
MRSVRSHFPLRILCQKLGFEHSSPTLRGSTMIVTWKCFNSLSFVTRCKRQTLQEHEYATLLAADERVVELFYPPYASVLKGSEQVIAAQEWKYSEK